jgi:hypothetical protein
MDEAEWLGCVEPAAMLAYLVGPDSSQMHLPAGRRAEWLDRKLRLFACACCRQVWGRLTDPRSRRAVEVAERHADGEAGKGEMRAAHDGALAVWHEAPNEWNGPLTLLMDYPAVGGHFSPGWVSPALQAALLRDVAGNPFRPPNLRRLNGHLCRLVSRHETPERPTRRGVVRSTLVREKWQHVAWLSPAVLGIARRAYDERDFSPAALGVLADALEEAGCREESVLRHLRGWAPCPVCLCADPPPGPGEWCTYCGTERWEPWEFRNGPHVRGCWAVDLILGKE